MTLTEIIVLLDRSGSMAPCARDYRGGLKQFVEDQKQLEGNVNFTLVLFDGENPFELVYDRVDIKQVGDIPLNPRGSTPLLDSFGKTIGHISDAINKSDKKPDQVIFMCITDGGENASKEFTIETIRNLVSSKEDVNQTTPPWNFLYLGANVDSFSVASGLGISNLGNVANYTQTSDNIWAACSGTSEAITRGRNAIFELGQSSIYEDKQIYYNAVSANMAYTEDEKIAFSK